MTKDDKSIKEYTPDERLKAVLLARQVGTAQAARILGISRTTLTYWVKITPEEEARNTPLREIEMQVQRDIINNTDKFLEEHYNALNKLFRLTLEKASDDIKKNNIKAWQAIAIAEKIANIIKTMSVTEVTHNTQVNNLLQFCISEVEKKG